MAICDGSVDRKLEGGINEKKHAAELVLEGHLLGENPAEVDLAELLQIAQREFKQVKALDEVELERGWPRLRAALGEAFLNWHKASARREIEPVQTPAIQAKPLPLWLEKLGQFRR
jgi:hypothetical protein